MDSRPHIARHSKDTYNIRAYLVLYFVIRLILVLTSLFLSVIAILYAVSNLITLSAVNIFCPVYTAEEVKENSREISKNHGVESDHTCWKIDRELFDAERVTSLSLNVFEAEISKNPAFSNIIGFMSFVLLGLLLLFIGLQHGYYLIYDLIFTIKTIHADGRQEDERLNPRVKQVRNQWAKKIRNQKKVNNHKNIKKNKDRLQNKAKQKKISAGQKTSTAISNSYSVIMDKYQTYLDLYERYFYFDSKYKIWSILGGELFEICVQFYGLCLLGGIDLLYPDSVVLSQEYYTVESFAIIVGLNCIITGLVWMIYIIFHNTWHGSLFFGLIFFVDSIFEITYALFPLLNLTQSNTLAITEESLGFLGQSNGFFTVQALLAVYFLTSKCWYLIDHLDPAAMENRHFMYVEKIKQGTYHDQQPWIATTEWSDYQQSVNSISRLSTLSVSSVGSDSRNRVVPFADRLHELIRNGGVMNSAVNVGNQFQGTTTLAVPTATATTAIPTTTATPILSRSNSKNEEIQLSPTVDAGEDKPTLDDDSDGAHPNNNDDNNGDGGKNSKPISDEQKNDYDSKIDSNITVESKINARSEDKRKQFLRKLSIVVIGVSLLGIGLMILFTFILDIEYNYKPKCKLNDNLSGNDIDWLSKHPEMLEFYNNSDLGARSRTHNICHRQVINLFSDYPCNCREFESYLDELEDRSVYRNLSILENVLKRWDMLEAFVVHGQDTPLGKEEAFNLTREMIKLPHLRIFYIERQNIAFIDSFIDTEMPNLGM